MANPNIVNVTNILGVTTSISITNTNTSNVLVSNASGSNKVYKINTIVASSTDSINAVDVTVKITQSAAGAGTSHALASTLTVPAKSSVVIVGKDNPVYLMENKSVIVLASAANDVDVTCSYEEIS